MVDTTFVSGTVIASTWLNDVNTATYKASSSIVGAAARTAISKASDNISIKDFGGIGNGAADDTAAINLAIAAASVLHVPIEVNGVFRHTSTITVSTKVGFKGTGWTSSNLSANRSLSCFLKDFNGVGFLFSGDDSFTDGVQYDSVAARTGDGVQVTGSRWDGRNGATTNFGGVGLRLGATEAGAHAINANCGLLTGWITLANGSHGVWMDNTNTLTSGTYPLGNPDVNGWTVSHVLCGSTGAGNGGDGFRVGNCITNVFTNIVGQSNTGNAIRFTTSARGHKIFGYYCESNTAGGLLFDSGAATNIAIGGHAIIAGQDAIDNDGTNLILAPSNTTPLLGMFYNRMRVANLAASGFADYYMSADTNGIDAVRLRGNQPSGSRGRFTVQTKTNGGALADRLVMDETITSLVNSANGFFIDKTAVDTTNPGLSLYSQAVAVGYGRIDYIKGTASGTGATVANGYYYNGAQVGHIDCTSTATSYNTSSDYRIKTNVVPLSGAAEKVKAIKWSEFEFIADPGKKVAGVIAHELQEVYPLAVSGKKDEQEERPVFNEQSEKIGTELVDKLQGVDLSKLVPILGAALKEALEKIDALQARLDKKK